MPAAKRLDLLAVLECGLRVHRCHERSRAAPV
jgi:hypothetical protein